MKRMLGFAMLTALSAQGIAITQSLLLANTYTRYAVYSLAPGDTTRFAPDIYDLPLAGASSYYDAATVASWDGYSYAHNLIRTSFLPSRITMEAQATVSHRGSVASQTWMYFQVDHPIQVEIKSEVSLLKLVWWDRAIVNLMSNGGLIAQFNSDEGTQNGSTTVTLQPGINYRFYTGLNRNNIYYGTEANNTNTAFGTLTVLGTRYSQVIDPTFVGDFSTRKLNIELWQNGSLVETLCDISMLPNGEFAFSPVTRGEVTLKIKGGAWLARRMPDVFLTNNPVELPQLMFISGDIDQDGEVGSSDFDAVVTAYGQTGSSIPADVDGDNEVGSSDYDIVVTNFGLADE